MTRQERLAGRNAEIRDFIAKLERRHPRWKRSAIVAEAAARFFLSTRTVEAIWWKQGAYED